jgi:hypothetical protein
MTESAHGRRVSDNSDETHLRAVDRMRRLSDHQSTLPLPRSGPAIGGHLEVAGQPVRRFLEPIA